MIRVKSDPFWLIKRSCVAADWSFYYFSFYILVILGVDQCVNFSFVNWSFNELVIILIFFLYNGHFMNLSVIMSQVKFDAVNTQ
jgi:hypothetical protein